MIEQAPELINAERTRPLAKHGDVAIVIAFEAANQSNETGLTATHLAEVIPLHPEGPTNPTTPQLDGIGLDLSGVPRHHRFELYDSNEKFAS